MGLEPTTTGITILDSTIELQSPYRNTLRNLTVLPDNWHCMAKTETESDNSLTFADLPGAHRSTNVFLYGVSTMPYASVIASVISIRDSEPRYLSRR